MNKLILVLSLVLIPSLKLIGQIPNFTVLDSNQVQYEFHEFIEENKTTLVTYWAEWCAPCRWELNSWKDYTENWLDHKNLNLIAISTDDEDDYNAAIAMWNENEWQGQLLFSNSIGSSIPRYFLYDKNQELIRDKTGYSSDDVVELDHIIDSLNNFISPIREKLKEEIDVGILNNQLTLRSSIDLGLVEIMIYSIDGGLVAYHKAEIFGNSLYFNSYNDLTGIFVIQLLGENLEFSQLLYAN